MLEKGKTIAVIGAGIIGVTNARALQKKGYRVILFDKNEPGMGASFGNAGYIAIDEVIPLSHGVSPGAVMKMLAKPLAPLSIRWQQIFSLMPWFMKFLKFSRGEYAGKGALALTSLQKKALKSWQTLITEDKLASQVRKNGAMLVFETEAGFKQEAEKFPFMREQGVKFEILDGDQARELVPELAQSVTKAIFFPKGSHVTDPHNVVKSLFENFEKAQGKFVKEEVYQIMCQEGEAPAIVTKNTGYEVDAVVVTAGYQSGEILSSLDIPVPLVAERGYHTVMDHEPLGFDMAIGSHERGFFITPMEGGLRLAGTVEFSPADKNPPPNWKRADILVHHTKELLPGVLGDEKSRWMGHRPTLPDFLPVMGASETHQNLYYNFGHQHLGLTLSAISAEVLADLISTGKSPIDLKPFDINRF